MPALAAAALPTILATGDAIAGHNVVVLAAYPLAALGAVALAVRLGVGLGPALVAGLVFAYSPRLLHQAHNVQTLAAFWIPWLFLALERLLARPTWLAAALAAGAGLGLALSIMILFMYASVAAVVFLVVAVVWGGRRLGWVHLVRLGGVSLAAVALLAVYLGPYRSLAREWGLARTLAEVEASSTSPADLLGVPPEHLLHRLIGVGRVVDLDHEALYPGLAVAVLAAIGLCATLRDRGGLRRGLIPYLAMSGVALILAFGPTLRTASGAVPLPYRLLYAVVPGFDLLRTPRRFAAFAALGLALLAAVGAAEVVRRLRPGSRAAVALAGLAGLVLLESATVPFPGTVRRFDPRGLPPVYRWLAAQDPETVAFELPMGDNVVKLIAATIHLRRTVNGAASYVPPRYHDLGAAMVAFPDERTVALIEGIRPDLVLVDRARLGPAREAALGAFAGRLRLVEAIGPHLVLRVEGPPPPGVAQLLAMAELGRAPGDGSWRACVTFSNPSARFVPLYPARRLLLEVEGDPGQPRATATRWLPLDVAPGASHTECVGLPGSPGTIRVRGEAQEAGRVYRFSLTPGAPARPLDAAQS